MLAMSTDWSEVQSGHLGLRTEIIINKGLSRLLLIITITICFLQGAQESEPGFPSFHFTFTKFLWISRLREREMGPSFTTKHGFELRSPPPVLIRHPNHYTTLPWCAINILFFYVALWMCISLDFMEYKKVCPMSKSQAKSLKFDVREATEGGEGNRGGEKPVKDMCLL